MSPPPRVLEWLLGHVLDRRDRETVLGDLQEEYARIVAARGRRAAIRWYLGQSAGAVIPSVRRRLAPRAATLSRTAPTGRGGWGLDGLGRDMAHAWRSLRRRPGHALAATLTLALAIGANAATFGVIDAVLLRPLSYPGSDRIVSLSETHPQRMTDPGWVSIPNVRDWRSQSRTLQALALFRAGSMAVTGAGEPVYVVGMRVGAGFFDVFGTPATVGRALIGAGDVSGGAGVVLSHRFWTRQYNASPSVIGTTLILDGTPRVIAGVMPAGYNAAGDWIGAPIDVWVPYDFAAASGAGRGDRSYNAVGRLRDGASFADASAELSLIGARLSAEYPNANAGWTVRMTPWKELIVGGTRRILFPLWAAMGLVLLVACANVGNLVLNRALANGPALAVRAALGARSGRLVRGVLAESVLVALSGAALGLPLAMLLVAATRALDPGDLPRLAASVVDFRVVAVTALAALLVGVLLGLYPAWRAARATAHGTLRSSRSGAPPGPRRLRQAMAGVQIAVAVALLAGSALVLRGFLRLRDVSPGFEARGVVTATVVLSWDRVPDLDDRVAFTKLALERLRALPGVEAAAMINSLPFSGSSAQQTFGMAGRPPDAADARFAGIRGISPGYAATMRIPVRGREFQDQDLRGRPRVVLVNETLARKYFPGTDAMGERLTLFGGNMQAEIVGVIGDVHHVALDAPPVAEIYVPYTADFLSSKTYLVRTPNEPASLANAVRRAIHEVDHAQPLRAIGPDRTETVPLDRLVAASLAGRRFHTLVLVLLAGLAVLLSAVGLSAVIAVTVTERLQEIGLRMALGAARGTVLRWVLLRSARLAAWGLAGGVAIELLGGSALESLIFDLSARDPQTLALAAALFALVALTAVLAPALRATRVDPGRVLRGE